MDASGKRNESVEFANSILPRGIDVLAVTLRCRGTETQSKLNQLGFVVQVGFRSIQLLLSASLSLCVSVVLRRQVRFLEVSLANVDLLHSEDDPHRVGPAIHRSGYEGSVLAEGHLELVKHATIPRRMYHSG